MSTNLTQREINEIVGLHRAGVSRKDICTKTGRSLATVNRHIKAAAEKPLCPKCGQELPPHAHFCYMCGVKILTEREQLAEDLSKLRGVFNLLPEHTRDHAIKTLNTAIAYLEKEDS